MDSLNVALAVGLPLVGGLVWLIRLEGRVKTQEALLAKFVEDVQYIRERIDAALNGHHHK